LTKSMIHSLVKGGEGDMGERIGERKKIEIM
jgi:hypothetical protein